MSDEQIKTLYNIVDKLEKRIFLLEKVLASHAKCIGELRGEELMSKTLRGPIHITFKLIKGKYVLYYKGKRYQT